MRTEIKEAVEKQSTSSKVMETKARCWKAKESVVSAKWKQNVNFSFTKFGGMPSQSSG